MTDRWSQAVEQSVALVRRSWPHQPRVAIVLGSGLAESGRLIRSESCIEYRQLPLFPQSTADGHAGLLICGRIESVPVVALIGRAHAYEGYCSEELALPVRLIHALGASQLVLTNASGGLNPGFSRGDVMVIRDHICFQHFLLPQEFVRREGAGNGSVSLHHSAYDDSLADWAVEHGRRNGTALQQGVYVAVTGPNYETRAEYRMFRNLGGDAVGMSTALEATVAARLGLRTLGLSMIANIALPDCPQRVTHEEVLAAGALARPVMEEIVVGLVKQSH